MEYVANKLNVGFITYDYPGYGYPSEKRSEYACYESINSVMDM